MDLKDSGQQAQDSLEDLLIYDDMFLDYFNAFLSLPAFPQVLQYHRLTGTFRIINTPDDSLVEYSTSEPMYGATDEERETIMTWSQNERMPLFNKTELFREYKLSKLLLRPVDARRVGARSGTYVRGYSRTSGSLGSLTDTDAPGSSNDEDEDDLDEEQETEYQEGGATTGNDISDLSSSLVADRPPTHTRSLPARLAPRGTKSHRRQTNRGTTSATPASGGDSGGSGIAIDISATTPGQWGPSGPVGRTQSAPLNYQEFAKLPMNADFDLLPEELQAPLVSFSTKPGETGGGPSDMLDVKSLEARQNLPFDRLKEMMLANREGVQEFFEFLRPTAGMQLVDFWLDCEFYKDTVFDRSDADNRQTRSRLLRDLQDKYRLRLTEDAKMQMRSAANDPQQANSILLRTQYDVLRRLRSYWLPRYIIHKERVLSGHTFSDLQHAWLSEASRRVSVVSTIFPSLSLVNKMPVRPDMAQNLALTEEWERVRAGGRRLDDRIRSARGQQVPTIVTAAATKPISATRPFQLRLRDALTVDRIAGGPFRSFLEHRHRDPELLACLLFFQEVEEYSKRDERTSDRFLRLGHAWNIFNRYLNVSASHPIRMDKRECQSVLDALRRSKDIVPSRVFAKAQDSVVARMGDTWLRFLREDVKNFLESSVSHRDSGSPPRTSDEIQVYIENGKIIVKYLQPEKSKPELALRRRSWDFLTDDEKAERRRAAAERNRITELERQKALKAARKRLRQMEEAGRKNLKPLIEEEPGTTEEAAETTFTSQPETTKEDFQGRASSKKVEEEKEEVEKPPELKDMTKNRAVMALFKKFANDKEGKDAVNALSLYQETLEFLELPPGTNEKAKKKRDSNSLYLFKTYLEKGCKRKVEVTSERLQQRLAFDKDRPKTPTLKELSTHLHQKLNASFVNFWHFQSEQMGIDMSALKNMSEKEIRMRADLDKGVVASKRGKKATGKATPTKEDKVEFLVALEKNLSGPLSLQMMYFYRYLMQYSVQDKVPHLDKNLFFYVEAQKYKEFVQGGCDEDFLKRKIIVISNIFLESVFPPPLQITITNDLHQRTLRNVQKYSNPKFKEEISATVFDEAQFAVFKDMLPYWAGFMRQWSPAGKEYRPVSNQKRMLEERMEKIEKFTKPNVNFKLPELPTKGVGPVSSLSLTLMEGIKWKETNQDPMNTGETSEKDIGSLEPRKSIIRLPPSITQMRMKEETEGTI